MDYFHDNVYNHKEHIESKNIDFFLNIEHNLSNEDPNSIMEALQLRKLWKRLTPDEKINNQETIFMYLSCMVYCVKLYKGY